MSNFSSFSAISTMLQTTNIVCHSVHLTDELKIGLEYDIHGGLLNIFVKNTGRHTETPCQINVLAHPQEHARLRWDDPSPSKLDADRHDQINDVIDRNDAADDEPKICIEVSNIYVYDLFDEDEPCETIASFYSSTSSSSCCFDDPTTDNDDGYSTHSLDDTDQQQALASLPCKLIVPFSDDQYHAYANVCVSPIRRLIEQLMWSSPFKKSVRQMMSNRAFHSLMI